MALIKKGEHCKLAHFNEAIVDIKLAFCKFIR